MPDEVRDWLLDRATDDNGIEDQRRAALEMLLLDYTDVDTNVHAIAPWAVRPLVAAVDAMTERFDGLDVTPALGYLPTEAPRPSWASGDAVAMCAALVVAASGVHRADDVNAMINSVGLGDRTPNFTVDDVLDAVELAWRYDGGKYMPAGAVLSHLGIRDLAEAARELDGGELESYLLALAAGVPRYSGGSRVMTVLTWATVMRDNGLPVDGTRQRQRVLRELCFQERLTVDEVVEVLGDLDTELIDHFTVDGVPLTELLEGMFDLPPWARPLIEP